MSGSELSLLDLDAIHAAQLAEWTDGIRVIRGEGGMGMKETSSYIQILAELALKVRLLDVTGDGIELPEKVAYGLRESEPSESLTVTDTQRHGVWTFGSPSDECVYIITAVHDDTVTSQHVQRSS